MKPSLRHELRSCVGSPANHDMHQSQQPIVVIVEPKFFHASADKPENVLRKNGFVWDRPSVGKTLALRSFAERNKGSVVVVESERGDQLLEQDRSLRPLGLPGQVESLALGVGVAVEPTRVGHAIHDSAEKRVAVCLGEHAGKDDGSFSSVNPKEGAR